MTYDQQKHNILASHSKYFCKIGDPLMSQSLNLGLTIDNGLTMCVLFLITFKEASLPLRGFLRFMYQINGTRSKSIVKSITFAFLMKIFLAGG